MQLITANKKTLNVTLLNPTTKQAQTKVHSYAYTKKGTSICDAYNKPSSKKVYAYNEIREEMSDVNGYAIRITGAGCDIFSCAYKVKDKEGHEYLIYHTPSNRFAIQLD